jgi:diaminopimelate epimerase
MEKMKFFKYQALGNDYLVIEGMTGQGGDIALVQRICDRHRGVGGDGVLIGGRGRDETEVTLRIFNPDGSEAEKSGNGLRIFARYAWDTRLVASDAFTVVTAGGRVRCEIRDGGRVVFAEMGRASFDSADIPVDGPRREVIRETIDVQGRAVPFTAVSVGNPHCVVHVDHLTPSLARELGPSIECHPRFPKRINVQFVRILDPHRIQIEIWERGAGYTLASGTSSCAAAAASVRLGHCTAGDIAVRMPGGTLKIGVSEALDLTMLGPVRKVAEGNLSAELFEPDRFDSQPSSSK